MMLKVQKFAAIQQKGFIQTLTGHTVEVRRGLLDGNFFDYLLDMIFI